MKMIFLGMVGILLIAELIPHFWFRDRESAFKPLVAQSDVRTVSLKGEPVSDLLSFDQGSHYFSDTGGDITLTLMTWEEGNSHGLMDAFGHSPEVCLPVSGAELLEKYPVRTVDIGDETILVESWIFSHPLFSRKLHAFKIARCDHPDLRKMGTDRKMVMARLMLFRAGRVMPDIQIGIGIVKGTNDPGLAYERFARFLTGKFQLKSR